MRISLLLLCICIFYSSFATVYVDDYYRSDGTYVRSHTRSDPSPSSDGPYSGTYVPQPIVPNGGLHYWTPPKPIITTSCPLNSHEIAEKKCVCDEGYSVLEIPGFESCMLDYYVDKYNSRNQPPHGLNEGTVNFRSSEENRRDTLRKADSLGYYNPNTKSDGAHCDLPSIGNFVSTGLSNSPGCECPKNYQISSKIITTIDGEDIYEYSCIKDNNLVCTDTKPGTFYSVINSTCLCNNGVKWREKTHCNKTWRDNSIIIFIFNIFH